MADETPRLRSPSRWLPRAVFGGVLMGLANLVPGISGGTMLLAAGIYTRFIEAVARVSRLQLERAALTLLMVVGGAALMAILLLAGPVKDLVVGYRWIMYSLFVGLTLGGIPALWRLARPRSAALWFGAAAGFLLMALLGEVQRAGAAGGDGPEGFAILFLAGVAGAASMILPGVSGGYVLLVMGQYVRILAAIEAALDGLRALDPGAVMAPAFGVFLPVGLGMVMGIAGISNLLRWCLRHQRAATLGLLLGLLAGAVVGLWPFQRGIPPEPGSQVKGETVTLENRTLFAPEDWPVVTFRPRAGQAAGSLALVGLGFLITLSVARMGRQPGTDI